MLLALPYSYMKDVIVWFVNDSNVMSLYFNQTIKIKKKIPSTNNFIASDHEIDRIGNVVINYRVINSKYRRF